MVHPRRAENNKEAATALKDLRSRPPISPVLEAAPALPSPSTSGTPDRDTCVSDDHRGAQLRALRRRTGSPPPCEGTALDQDEQHVCETSQQADHQEP